MQVNTLTRISHKTGSRFVKTHDLYKNRPSLRSAALQDYTYYHYTHRKIPVLMVLIIEACEAIPFLHKRLKRKNPSVVMLLTALWHKNGYNFTALHCTIFF